MERGSSVGDQFYTIDNTVKENLNMQNSRSSHNHDLNHQKQQPILLPHSYVSVKPQQTLVPQAPQNQATQSVCNVGGQQMKLKMRVVKQQQPAQHQQQVPLNILGLCPAGGLQRANTIGNDVASKMRSNSNNTRQIVVRKVFLITDTIEQPIRVEERRPVDVRDQ